MSDPPDRENGPPEPRGGTLSKLLAIQGRLETHGDRIGDLEEQVGRLAGVIEEAADSAERSDGAPQDPKLPPIWWALLSEQQYGELRPRFLAWLRDVLAPAHPAAVRELSLCWAQHPIAEGALTAAWRTWQAAYGDRDADARDDADWWLRWCPALLELAAKECGECRERRHHEEPQAVSATLLATFEPVRDRSGT